MNWKELRNRILGDPDAIEAYHEAWDERADYNDYQIERYGWGWVPETPEDARLRDRVVEAERHIPRWRRR